MRPSSLHQSLECRPSFANLWQARLRTREVREKLLVFVDRLIVLAGTLVELAKIVVAQNSDHGKTLRQSPGVFHRALAP